MSMWTKVLLVALGLLLGIGGAVLGAEIIIRVMYPSTRGTQFSSLDELRRTILQGNAQSDPALSSPDSGGNLRALVNPHPSDRIIFDLKPSLDLTFQRARVRTNSCGMRDKERSIAKPPDTYRIALLGDSFVFGWGVEFEQTFAQRLEGNLNRLAEGKRQFEVLNFGVPGYATFQESAKFLESGIEFMPDEVLVFFIQNDFDFPFFVHDVRKPGGLMALGDFLRVTRASLTPDLEEQKKKLSAADPNTALAELADYCSRQGIRLSLAITPRREWKQYYRRLPILRSRKDIRFISLRSDFIRLVKDRGIPEKDLTLSFDPHPSPIRHAIYGDILTPYFMDRLP